MVDPRQTPPRRKTLAGAGIGITAAALLYTIVPAFESGRTVETHVVGDQLHIRNVRGPEHLVPYRDIVGIWTVCDGDTKDVHAETREGCQARLEDQLVAHAEPVMACVPMLRRPDRQNQLAASVSLAYNIGSSGFCHSTAARLFNAGQLRAGCNAFLRFNRAGGRIVRGLDVRRHKEQTICLRGI